jgi:hypothetical protein
VQKKRSFPKQGWVGLGLVAVFWPVNWFAPGLRTAWAFFPLWLGYALVMDGLAYQSSGTSLLTRSWKRYIGLFFISVPGWWLFELINQQVQNWHYLGLEACTPLEYFLIASLNFSIVIPAVFGAAEWLSNTRFIQGLKPGPIIRPNRRTTVGFFITGLVMLALLLALPRYFFPFFWISLYFILEPVNVWLGHHSLAEHTQRGDWRPIISLFAGVLLTGFFWEMWNYYSFPKWIYTVPWVDFGHIFEMPLLGYGGYLPFSLELTALYHLAVGLLGQGRQAYLKFDLPA